MSGDKNLFEQIAEIKADTEAVKNAPKTLREQLREKDPKVFEFIANAELVWKYNGKSLQKKREDKKLKNQLLVMVVLFVIQVALCVLSAVFISEYLWIGTFISILLTILYLYFRTHEVSTCKYPLTFQYRQKKKLAYLKYETDANGVSDVTELSFAAKAVSVCLAVAEFLQGTIAMVLSKDLIWIVCSCFCAIWALELLFIFTKRFRFRWILCLEDEKNTIAYNQLNEFIYENNIEIKAIKEERHE